MENDEVWCCDPQHDSPCKGSCDACQDECNPKYFFSGSYEEAINQLNKNIKLAELEVH